MSAGRPGEGAPQAAKFYARSTPGLARRKTGGSVGRSKGRAGDRHCAPTAPRHLLARRDRDAGGYCRARPAPACVPRAAPPRAGTRAAGTAAVSWNQTDPSRTCDLALRVATASKAATRTASRVVVVLELGHPGDSTTAAIAATSSAQFLPPGSRVVEFTSLLPGARRARAARRAPPDLTLCTRAMLRAMARPQT